MLRRWMCLAVGLGALAAYADWPDGWGKVVDDVRERAAAHPYRLERAWRLD
ncbi:hypothetical protein [Pedosphaera parvula]|uniref:Uncharacterized protein n=1 Tax=Pedosphaera parvula (strain Ellin514) TaxID=320771 RepID=B9XJK1_PEDPL|nr:hypothetical protein [Pedosphaera parvula]EEF60062.1 hypothetical protein Cflav_PD3121 [Pedosphaera parvula Ellin514]